MALKLYLCKDRKYCSVNNGAVRAKNTLGNTTRHRRIGENGLYLNSEGEFANFNSIFQYAADSGQMHFKRHYPSDFLFMDVQLSMDLSLL